ncbi:MULTISPECIES: DUF302 domain-containing protein [unclassified Thioalkalivibrio]|uniref:DUF302 domain-containing protein n=1 Tax=unclassified Thioalkalivibrio TaxID=2621013 RepID=UPI0003607702|nr:MULTISPECIES: DUF302 domain-containing protein [unclassified Thioalkalivibrio]
MKKTLLATTLSLALAATSAQAFDVDGMITKASPHSAAETLDRLESALEANDVDVALRWDHADKAAGEDIDLGPTELLLFGNPALGSHMFTSRQHAGIDLPMKALAWTDADGQTWLAYNDPEWLAERHGINDREEIVEQMSNALDNLSDAAVADD